MGIRGYFVLYMLPPSFPFSKKINNLIKFSTGSESTDHWLAVPVCFATLPSTKSAFGWFVVPRGRRPQGCSGTHHDSVLCNTNISDQGKREKKKRESCSDYTKATELLGTGKRVEYPTEHFTFLQHQNKVNQKNYVAQ